MEALLEHCTANDAGGAGENDFHCDDLVGDDYESVVAKLRNKQIYTKVIDYYTISPKAQIRYGLYFGDISNTDEEAKNEAKNECVIHVNNVRFPVNTTCMPPNRQVRGPNNRRWRHSPFRNIRCSVVGS